MEESSSSVQIHSRKRKKNCPSLLNSEAIVGISTRSKSRSHNCSGVSRSDPVPEKPISFQPKIEPEEAFLDANCITDSRVSSIKDLRIRRVFTPDVISVSDREDDEENEERKKMSKGLDPGSDMSKGLDPGSDNSQVLDSLVGDASVDEPENAEIMTSEIKDGGNCVENGLNLNDREVLGNESLSRSKTALNKCAPRKVFKNSSSFSFRRLLPYLMDIVNDDSCASKIEIVDAGIPCNLRKLDGEKNSKVLSTSENIYTSKVEHARSGIDDTNSSHHEDSREFHIEVPINQPDLNGAETALDQAPENIRPEEVEQICHENVAERTGASVEEECCQMTPPDTDMFTRREVALDGKSVEPNNVLAENQISNELLGGKDKINCDAFRQSPSPTSKSGTNLMNRPVLNPCSRSRLFKNPGSVSYRRLLPFLMDMSKNDSCASRIAEHPVPQVDVSEDLHPAVTTEKDYTEKIGPENPHEKQHTEDRTQDLLSSTIPLPTSDGSSPDTENNWQSMPQSCSTKYSSNVESDSVTSEIPPDPGMLIVQSNEMATSQSTDRNLEHYKENGSASSPSSSNNVISTEQSISKEHGLVGEPETCLNMKLDLHNYGGQSVEKVKLQQSAAEIEVSDDLISPTNGSSKGILKRNRRGCRGLCNCLNCASFRLHADRAFEFSRNQMHDAEEVALDLMNELANLRHLLKKSIDADNDPAHIQLNPVLFNQACDKALETEKLAKERLRQLKDDLNVHCRIPTLLQPKVTFANYIEERAIPVLEPSTSPEKKV